MAFGFKLNNAAGTPFYDTSVIGGMYLGAFTASAGSNASFTIPHIDLINTIYIQKFMVNDIPTNQEAYSHTVSSNSTTGVVTATSVGTSNQSQTTHILILGK
jgi:UDP-glucose 6-dehydrogenase